MPRATHSLSFRCTAKAKANKNKGLRFAERNESFRIEGIKSLKSLRAPNQLFRGTFCFQWVDPNFVSRRFRVRPF